MTHRNINTHGFRLYVIEAGGLRDGDRLDDCAKDHSMEQRA